jgi:putative ABC transport system ATP-binding protein
MIHVENLQKTYPGKVPTLALRGVSFDIAEGEFVAIMGRSGSGKSTLLHQLSLIDTPTGGSLSIGEVDVLAFSDAERVRFRLENLGYVFQEYALISELTALENVFIPAMAKGEDALLYRERSVDLLRLVGLEQRLAYYPHELSGGEQQRVAIARALINSPKILFADEPTANLDSTSAQVVLELFQRLNKEFGQTIVMVTHEHDDVRFVDRVISMKDGVLSPE